MKDLFKSLKKLDTPLAWGIASAVFGLCFILVPTAALDIILLITGILVIALGVVRLINLLVAPSGSVTFIISVVINAVILLFGINLSTARSGYAYSICTTVGTYLAILSLFKLISAFRIAAPSRNKSWWINTVISSLMLAAGLWLLIFPTWPKEMAGASLILLATEFFIRAKNRTASGITEAARDVFEGSFIDRS